MYVGAVLLAALALLQCPGGFLACYVPLGAAIITPWKLRGSGKDSRLRRPTAGGFRPSLRAVLSIGGRSALSTVNLVDTQTDFYSVTVKDHTGADTGIADCTQFFRGKRDYRSAAYCLARSIEYSLTRHKFAEAELLYRAARSDEQLRGQPAAMAAEAHFLTAVGLHSEALDLLLAACDATLRPPAQLQAQIIDACVESDRYLEGGQWRWSGWRRFRMVWHGQLAAVILALAADARQLAHAEPDEALRLAYRICRLPDRVAVSVRVAMSIGALHRMYLARGTALDVIGNIYRGRGEQEEAGSAFADAHEEFRQARNRTRAARSLVLASTCALAAGDKEPEQENHLLDLIRVGLQLLESDRGTLRGEDSRAGWIAAQRELYAAVFSELSNIICASAKAGELGLWLLESLHRSLNADVIATAREGIAYDAALLAMLAELANYETESAQASSGKQQGRAPDPADAAALRDKVRRRLSELLEGDFVAESTDLEVALARLGDRLAVLYHCWREGSGWIVQSVLVSPAGGIRVHQARLTVPVQSEDISPWLTPIGVLDALDAAEPEAVTRLLLDTPLDDDVWRELAEAMLPAAWWDVLCPDGSKPVEVLIVPDGPIASLPLAALPVRDGKPLIEFATLAMTPSLSMLKLPQAPPPHAGTVRIAVVHLDWAESLDQVSFEAQQWQLAAQRMHVVDTADQHGLEAALVAVPAPDLVAISVHGSPGEAPAGDGRRAFGTKVHLRDGSVLSAASALRLPWPQTVILGACWISGVAIRAGREPFGFPLACLLRGASTIIGGIAPIPDEEAARILGEVIGRLPGDRDIVGALCGTQRAELSRIQLSAATAAQITGLVAWTIAPSRRPAPSPGIRLYWDAGGLARTDARATYSPVPALSESVRMVLVQGQYLAGDRPAGTLDFLVGALSADTADWTGFLVACGVGEPRLPGAADGGTGDAIRVEGCGRDVSVTPALLKALRRGQLTADHMHDEVMLPAHVILAALCDQETAVARWLRRNMLAAAGDWQRHLSDRIFATTIPSPRVVLGLGQPTARRSVHTARMKGAKLSEAQVKALGMRRSWRKPALVGAIILFLPAINLLGYPIGSPDRGGTLGVVLGTSHAHGAAVITVFPGSAAARAGLYAGDVITAIGDAPVNSPSAAIDAISIHQPGTRISLSVIGDGRPIVVSAVLTAPIVVRNAGYIGVLVHSEVSGVLVLQIAPGGPAAAAGLRAGDVITSVSGLSDGGSAEAAVFLMRIHHPGERIRLSILRDGRPMTLVVTTTSPP